MTPHQDLVLVAGGQKGAVGADSQAVEGVLVVVIRFPQKLSEGTP